VTETPNEFAQHIHMLRDAKGLSRRSLATLTGVSPVTIWKWENGDNRPRRRFIPSLAQALEVSPIALRTLAAKDVARAYEAASPDQEEASTATISSPESGQQHALDDVIAKAKAMVAEASGTSPSHVTIRIEY
jgi:transcriptional regulator with XRE-family HTH domain